MSADRSDDDPIKEAIPFSNRLVGGGVIVFGMLMAVFSISTLAQMRDALDRNSAIATAALAIILVSVGAVLGYRDYLPKKIVATTTIGIGVLGIVAGVGTLGWVGYNLFVERQKEFHPGRLGLPFIMIAVGYGFVRKGISALK